MARRGLRQIAIATAVLLGSTDICPAPQIVCTSQCGDLDDSGGVIDNRDFLLLLAELAREVSPFGGAPWCLDSGSGGAAWNGDSYIDMIDLVGWDAVIGGEWPAEGLCNPISGMRVGLRGATGDKGVTLPQTTSLFIAGKTSGAGDQEDYIFTIRPDGACVGAIQRPPSVPHPSEGFRAGGRLVKDGAGDVYQIHATQGLIRARDGEVVVAPGSFPLGDETVYVGINDLGSNGFTGVPLLDAVFDSSSTDIVYVVPLLVEPSGGGCAYRAAAKLVLTEAPDGGFTYAVAMLYGHDPDTDPSNTSPRDPDFPCDHVILSEPDVQHVREIEVDAAGHVYVAAAQAFGENDWLLVYDSELGTASEQRFLISDHVAGPTAMRLSADGDRLYLASSVSASTDGSTAVHRFSVTHSGDTNVTYDGAIGIANPTANDQDCGGVSCGHYALITSIEEGSPADGTLYVTGYSAPRFDEDLDPNDDIFDPATGQILATPTLAVIPPAANGAVLPPAAPPIQAEAIVCHDLALPVSAVFVAGCASTAVCSNADVNCDNVVNGLDIAAISSSANFGRPVGDAAEPRADVDADGVVNGLDVAAASSSACFGQ